MLAVPARIAGCKEIVLCTPPGRDGKVHPAVLFAAKVAGVNRIFQSWRHTSHCRYGIRNGKCA